MHYGMRAFGPEDLETAGQLGFDFVEISLKEPVWVHRNLTLINRLKSRLGLFYVAHGPEEGNPKDLYGLRHDYLPKLKSAMELAQRIRAKFVTIHLWFDRRYVDQTTLQGKMALLKEMVEYGQAKKMGVFLENLSEEVEDLILPFFEVRQVGLTLDIGHGQLMRHQNTCFSIIDRIPERIKHVHVHDNQGGRSPRDDLHLPVGQGVVPIKEIVSGLVMSGYDGTMTLEVPAESLTESLEKVKEMVSQAQVLRAQASRTGQPSARESGPA
ncbi:MAG: sugar phosphate isomerase/epimerase [Deltaproteobacteria bacterium]|nr:sugar phosphate isomerase/epimerase [Deltaproteobacteria bacterium]